MATLADIIKKKKATGELTPDSLRAFIDLELERKLSEALQKALPEALGDMNARVEKALNLVIDERVAKALKGEKGDSVQGPPGKNAEDLDEVVARTVPVVLSHIQQPRDGNRGPKGDDGLDGYTPIPGKDYPTIPQVKEIASAVAEKTLVGKKGEDGSPDTPDQVVEKVNDATKKIKPDRVEGLVEKINDIVKRGSKGGGMGNVQHEHTSVSSATTSVSTTFNIGGGGYALWVYYNGQFIARGIDYTVSGKTLPLLFTPQDGTVMDVIYIRT